MAGGNRRARGTEKAVTECAGCPTLEVDADFGRVPHLSPTLRRMGDHEPHARSVSAWTASPRTAGALQIISRILLLFTQAVFYPAGILGERGVPPPPYLL